MDLQIMLKVIQKSTFMEKTSRETMGIIRLFLALILVVSYISKSDGQKLTNEELTTVLSQKEVPIRQPPAFTFPKDRKPNVISPRIIGGHVTAPNEYPFQVALYILVQITQYFCGGSLITPQIVLTAAHCVEDATSITVVLGAHNLYQTEPTQIAFNTSDYIIHEAWDRMVIQNDIALIRLPENVTLSNVISTVPLAQGTNTYAGLLSRCLGWGVTILGYVSDVLRYVDAEIISNDVCRSHEDYESYIVDHHLCTSGEGFVGSCNGDSGGPLLINGTQVGIVSFGSENCSSGLPSVYTRVTEFNSWVLNKLQNWTNEANSADDNPGGTGTSTGPLLGVFIGMILSVLFFNF